MTDPKRLFDCIPYHLARAPLPDMLAAKEQGAWRSYSTQEVKDMTAHLSAGLLQRGIGGGDGTPEGRDKIAILCKNRPEWIILDLAVQRSGAVLVPVYPNIHLQELAFILQDARVKLVFVHDGELYEKVQSIRAELPDLQAVYTFDLVPGLPHWGQLLSEADDAAIAAADAVAAGIRQEDLVTIIYTSGTTGTPKGVMLSHYNILCNIQSCLPCFPPGKPLRALSFLPLNHIFERMVTYLYLFRGIPVYYAESLDSIGANLKEVRPHLFTTVPRLLEKVYERIMEKGAEQRGLKRQLFFWAHGLAMRYEINRPLSPGYRLQLALANALVFRKWRQGLGNRVKCIVTGGAACQVRLIRIFTAAGIPIMEGYGLTETSPVISVNRYEVQDRMFGTVGPLVKDVQVRIAADGEILCKGPNIMMGYYKRPDLTAEVITEEGWYHTGDIGTMVDGKYLKITDRKKEIFKTSGGKYVAPLPIENKLRESPFIEQAMVTGAERKFASALIVPAFKALLGWAQKQGLATGDRAALLEQPEVQALYKELVDECNTLFNHVEQVKKFALLPQEWGVDSGELTPKLSLKRKEIERKYGSVIAGMYA
ncbi:AMP-dependent synthetase/ligase [Chitinophaga japonensis]|uniref:Long-chain acyl-CoA synthetase n=1 Tax=Chitinophaga japonensis TaxID=104662 RepID=A0A562SZD6_CHIJA|nr:long-chain fatty acid--CoA ligase [Chitinophaga japonensis]TWI86665.1 long-chain acyl-CoA synthetase [Chitinophaga japonensis]